MTTRRLTAATAALVLLAAALVAAHNTNAGQTPSDAATYVPPPHPHRTRDVEYRLSKRQLALWLPATAHPTPLMVVFARTATVGDVCARLADADVLNAAARDCALTKAADADAHSEALAAGESFEAAVEGAEPHHTLWLTCASAGVRALRVHPYAAPPLPPANYHSPAPSADAQKLYPNEAVDIVGDSVTGLVDYITSFVLNHFGDVHPFVTYPAAQSGRYWLDSGEPIPPGWSHRGPEHCDKALAAAFGVADACHWTPARDDDPLTVIAMTADWGSGTYESDVVAGLMSASDADYTVHVGDVYYSGTTEEHESNALGIPPPNVTRGVTWPHGRRGSFGLNGNHEMYSRGYGYFDRFLPTLGVRQNASNPNSPLMGQTASYFALENEHWRVIGLDTGYTTYNMLLPIDAPNNPLPDALVQWLNTTLRIGDPSDTRGLVFLSHHQYFTAFSDQLTPSLATPQQLVSLLPPGRVPLWLWGHEHRLSFYGLMNGGSLPLQVYGRCIGVGGFPVQLSPIPAAARDTNLTVFDDRTYAVEHGLWQTSVGFNGFTRLNFTGPTLTVEYRSTKLQPDGSSLYPDATDLLVLEHWTADAASGSVTLNAFDVVNANLTVIAYG